MKTKILDFLKNPSDNPVEDFNTGFALLQRTEGISQGTLRNYNNQGYTPQSLENIKYDLRKAHDISDLDVLNHVVTVPELIIVGPGYDQNLFVAANLDTFTNILKDMNDDEKSGLTISVQYPFLREVDCPDEMKILVADAITAFHNFRAAHTELYEKVVMPENTLLTEDEIYEIASGLLKDFELNREIHAELEHYAKTKEILGEHEQFADLKKSRELDALTAEQLMQKLNNLKSNISKKKGKLAKNPKLTEEDKIELSKIIEDLENQKLDLDARLKAKK